MTTKHLLEGAMQYVKAHGMREFSRLAKLDVGTVSRMAHGKPSIQIETLDRIHCNAGVPVDLMLTWYRLPAEAVLGRVPAKESP